MRYGHRTGADGHYRQYAAHFAVQAELTEQRCDQRRGGDQRHGGRTLRSFQRGGNHERHEQTDTQGRQGIAQVIAQRGDLQHGAERTASTGDQQDRRGGEDTFGDPVMQ
ncbi:hypothetical protein D9M68_810320 [compost metagenome]